MGNNRSNANVPAGWSQQDRRFGESIKQNLDVLQGHRGDKLDRAVTFRDLLDAGIVKLASGITNFNGLASSIAIVNEFPDLAIPPAPTNLQADGAFRNIILTWDLQLYKGHSAVQVWRHTSDVISSATMVAQVSGFTGVYADPVGSGKTFYYWVRAINNNDVTGPYNSSTGVQGVTAPDVDFLLTTLTNAVTSSQLASSLSGPIGNLPADTQAAIDLKKANIPTFSMTSFVLGDIVKESGSGTKLYIAIQAVPSNGRALSNTSFWKLYGDYNSLKSATDTAASDITDINTITSSSNSAAAVKLAAVDAILFDSGGNEIVSASNLSTMSSTVLNANGTARATATQFDQLAAAYTNPTTGVANNVTLQQALETSASSVNGLRSQYSVKIDANGAIAGFGLASTTTSLGVNESEFIVNADRFAIMRGGSNTTPASVPFIVQASATTINGVAVPAGVYMTDAFIRNGSIINAKIADAAIDNAKIANLSADKINAGTISTSRLNIDGSTLTSVDGVLQIANLAVTNAKIQNLAVSSAKIANLAATTAKIANLAVTTGKIQDLAVQTLKIADQAVIIPSSNFTGASQSTTSSTTQIQTVSFTSSGAPLLFLASYLATNENDETGFDNFNSLLKINGTQVHSVGHSKGRTERSNVSFAFTLTSNSAGSKTVTLSVTNNSFDSVSNVNLSVLEVKK